MFFILQCSFVNSARADVFALEQRHVRFARKLLIVCLGLSDILLNLPEAVIFRHIVSTIEYLVLGRAELSCAIIGVPFKDESSENGKVCVRLNALLLEYASARDHISYFFPEGPGGVLASGECFSRSGFGDLTCQINDEYDLGIETA